MKKYFTLIGAFAILLGTNAQLTENFDSYTVGDYMGVVSTEWTTWSGTTGGTEDVQVTDAQSSSGSNSIYFSSTSSAGGPQDVLVPFAGGPYTSGTFTFSSMFYVVAGKGGYFNFQEENTPGTSWNLDCYLKADNSITLENQTDGVMITSSYTSDTWFELKIVADLTQNNWELFIDNVSQGTFSNSNSKLASLDIYPVNGVSPNQCGYYMDDLHWDVVPYVPPVLDAAVTMVSIGSGLSGQSRAASVEVKNMGTDAVTSFTVTLDYNGSQMTESVSGQNLALLETATINLTNMITLVPGPMDATATISNVNGGTDSDASNDSKSTSLDPVVPAPGKLVIGEEGTGTWCGWCTRGHVFMEYMADNYDGYFQGVAVHNGDDMVNAIYDVGIGALIGGYPSGLVDRGTEADPSEFEAYFLQRIVIAPTVNITNGSTYDSGTRILKVSMKTDFVGAADSTWKVSCVLIEDNVTGTGSAYNQANYYSGGGSGVMGGYESLADPVPASQMTYMDVGRDISPSFDGYAGFDSSVVSGDSYVFRFEFTLAAGWNDTNITILTAVYNSSGTTDNASVVTFAEGEANGYIDTTAIFIAQAPAKFVDARVKVYPNPATSQTTVSVELSDKANVNVFVRNLAGQILMKRSFGFQNGTIQFPVNTSKLPAGIYLINVQTNDNITTEKLIVK